jgi:hypothetical protein
MVLWQGPRDKNKTGGDKKKDYAVTTGAKLCFENWVKSGT